MTEVPHIRSFGGNKEVWQDAIFLITEKAFLFCIANDGRSFVAATWWRNCLPNTAVLINTVEFFQQYRGIQKSNTAQAYRTTLVECPTTREEPRNIYPVILRRDLCMTLSSLSSTDVFNIPQILLRTPPDHMFDVYTLQYISCVGIWQTCITTKYMFPQLSCLFLSVNERGMHQNC